jgi:hypothetical protein
MARSALRLLVVDDDADMRCLLGEIFPAPMLLGLV